MDQTIYSDHLTLPHGDDAPFAEERYRYLRHCAEAGAAAASLQRKRNELLWIAARLGPDASEGIDIEALQWIATERQRQHGAISAAQRVVHIGRPWLRFLGWWREPAIVVQHQRQLDQYVTWMRQER